MILSHEHRFIFLKTTKTAGTSIEIALSRFCGPNDVITPISPEDEALRTELGYRGPQRYLSPIWEYRPRDIRRLMQGKGPKMRFYNHMSALEIRARVDPDVWRSYFKFCVARNPWDRAISLYYWWHQSTETRPGLSDFLKSKAPRKLMEKGWELYTISNEIAVDKVCRYEHLHADLEGVRVRLGLPEPLHLPGAKSSHRTERGTYRDSYGEAERELIRKGFQPEIEALRYEF